MRSPEPGASGAALAHAAFDALVDGHLPVLVRASTIAEELEEVLDPQTSGPLFRRWRRSLPCGGTCWRSVAWRSPRARSFGAWRESPRR